jgi:hypothetical protein
MFISIAWLSFCIAGIELQTSNVNRFLRFRFIHHKLFQNDHTNDNDKNDEPNPDNEQEDSNANIPAKNKRFLQLGQEAGLIILDAFFIFNHFMFYRLVLVNVDVQRAVADLIHQFHFVVFHLVKLSLVVFKILLDIGGFACLYVFLAGNIAEFL